MPVQFSRLRIAGFKSFAEPVTVEIRPGLTGIVGPNGCGKSNVVDALRWAMGEQNARTLRGGEMEDVIFAGTAGRPSRNIAEVALTLDETQGAAPPPFDAQPELEIMRRLERGGGGSAFRVNGKEVRARDVQTLFADLASAPALPPWSARAASARWSARSRKTVAPCWKKPPASPACMPAGTRPNSSCAPPRRTLPAPRMRKASSKPSLPA